MFNIEREQETVFLRVLGDVDFAVKYMFRHALDVVGQDACRAVVVDLSNTPYIDSAALGELLRAHKMWGERLTVALSDAGIVARIFAVSGLDRFFDIECKSSNVSDASAP